jgi:capsular polysaccharide biosynthesis protein
MTIKDQPIRSLLASWRALVGLGIAGALLALAVSFLQPLQYSSTVRLLITQPGSVNVDAFTVLKSNERIAQNLSQLLRTSTFFENILAQAQGVDANYFPSEEYERRRAWNRAIATSVDTGSGLMTISVYHSDVNQARGLVVAASNEIAKQAPNYFGSAIRVQVIDSPLDSRWFARPNFMNNAVYGLFTGIMLGILWSLLRKPERGE